MACDLTGGDALRNVDNGPVKLGVFLPTDRDSVPGILERDHREFFAGASPVGPLLLSAFALEELVDLLKRIGGVVGHCVLARLLRCLVKLVNRLGTWVNWWRRKGKQIRRRE